MSAFERLMSRQIFEIDEVTISVLLLMDMLPTTEIIA
jgi:hypothetical protein